jgi:iron complex outermembrane recepter protein
MNRNLAAALLGGTAIVTMATPVQAQEREFNVPAGSLKKALDAYARQSGLQVIYRVDDIRNIESKGARGRISAEQALNMILAGTGFSERRDASGAVAIYKAAGQEASQSGEADAASGAKTVSDETPDKDIVVTGSRIQGVADKFSPVQTYKREDFDRAGQTSTRDFIASLPQNFGGGVSPTNQGPGTGIGPGVVAVNLRGLGNRATLTLLNGRRLGRIGLSGAITDISAIPLSAIERVDVLTDGASAVYGADAVAGVVNFVLRRDFNGAETRLRYGSIDSAGASDYEIAQTFGIASSTAHAMISYQYTHSEPVLLRERDNQLPATSTAEILPKSNQHAIVVSGGANLSDKLKISADGIFSARDTFQNSENPFAGNFTDDASVKQYSLAGTLEYEVGRNWTISLSPAISHSSFRNKTLFEAGFGSIDKSSSQVVSIEGQVEGKLMESIAGETKLVFGGHFRDESFRARSISAVGGREVFSARNSRNVKAAFAELFVPLIGRDNGFSLANELSLSLAARYDDYSDAGSTFNPKFGLSYVPTEGFRLRASYGSSLRAPDLEQQRDQISFADIVYYNDGSAPGGYSTVLYLNGNRANLKPEESHSLNAGFDFEPTFLKGFSSRVTAYSIKYTKRIVFPGTGFEFVSGLPPFDFAYKDFEGAIIANPSLIELQNFIDKAQFVSNLTTNSLTDVTALLDGRISNAASTKTSGLDISLNQIISIHGGTLGLSVNANHIFKFDERNLDGGPIFSQYDRIFKPAKWRVRAGVSWAIDRLSVSSFFNYVDGYPNTIDNDDVPSFTTFDLSLAYALEGNGIARGLSLSLAATNIGDRRPPRIGQAAISGSPNSRNLYFDSTNHDPTGRRLVLQLTKKW